MQCSRVVRGAPVRVNASRGGAEHGRAASRLGAGVTGRAQAYPPAQTGYVGRQVASGQAAPRAGGGRGCRDHTGPGPQARETSGPPGTCANPEVASRDPVPRTTRPHLVARGSRCGGARRGDRTEGWGWRRGEGRGATLCLACPAGPGGGRSRRSRPGERGITCSPGGCERRKDLPPQPGCNVSLNCSGSAYHRYRVNRLIQVLRCPGHFVVFTIRSGPLPPPPESRRAFTLTPTLPRVQ